MLISLGEAMEFLESGPKKHRHLRWTLLSAQTETVIGVEGRVSELL
jgi:hypothetical protein